MGKRKWDAVSAYWDIGDDRMPVGHLATLETLLFEGSVGRIAEVDMQAGSALDTAERTPEVDSWRLLVLGGTIGLAAGPVAPTVALDGGSFDAATGMLQNNAVDDPLVLGKFAGQRLLDQGRLIFTGFALNYGSIGTGPVLLTQAGNVVVGGDRASPTIGKTGSTIDGIVCRGSGDPLSLGSAIEDKTFEFTSGGTPWISATWSTENPLAQRSSYVGTQTGIAVESDNQITNTGTSLDVSGGTYYVDFATTFGDIIIEMYGDVAPQAVQNFLNYAEDMTVGAGYYESFFHLLAPSFILQGGGYDFINGAPATITAGPPVPNEFSTAHPDVEGTVALAQVGSNPNSGTDQFFFNLADNSSSLNDFTVFGTVTAASWPVVEAIANLPTLDAGGAFSELPVQGTIDGDVITADNLVSISNVDVGTTPPCYCRGTAIRTPSGDAAVEVLQIGDPVMTASGATRTIRWIGRRSYDGRFVSGRRDILPIVIKQDALSNGVPLRDLQVSPKHAMFLDGVLIPAERLINGVSVTQVEQVDELTYFHIELESHDILIAEGAAAESFIDQDSRMMFQNVLEVVWTCTSPAVSDCAPRIEDGEILANVRSRIALRAGLAVDHAEDAAEVGPLDGRVDVLDVGMISGWAFDATRPHTPVRLEVLLDGRATASCVANSFRPDLRDAGKGDGRCAFHCSLSEPLSGETAHHVQVRRVSDGAVLADITQAEAPRKPGPLDGRIDLCSLVTVEGWALDTAWPNIAVRLEVLEGDMVIGETLANRYRVDLAQARKGNGKCGFVFRFGVPPRDLRRIKVRRATDRIFVPEFAERVTAA